MPQRDYRPDWWLVNAWNRGVVWKGVFSWSAAKMDALSLSKNYFRTTLKKGHLDLPLSVTDKAVLETVWI